MTRFTTTNLQVVLQGLYCTQGAVCPLRYALQKLTLQGPCSPRQSFATCNHADAGLMLPTFPKGISGACIAGSTVGSQLWLAHKWALQRMQYFYRPRSKPMVGLLQKLLLKMEKRSAGSKTAGTTPEPASAPACQLKA